MKDFLVIGQYSGIVVTSPNDKFMAMKTITGSNPVMVLLKKATLKPIYAYGLRRCDEFAVSNKGHIAVIEFDHDSLRSTIYCIDPEGCLMFKKESESFPSTMSFDYTSKHLVVFFAGEEKHIESYSLVWLDSTTGNLVKAIQSPGLSTIHEIHFDEKNKVSFK